jgi:hypothetical protein
MSVVVAVLAALPAVDSGVSGFHTQTSQFITALSSHQIDAAMETAFTYFTIPVMLPAVLKSALRFGLREPST